MERRTIGSFIAALRKARGMTQREVAERLNVSDKTISKWERDDGYPEITIIPALAELFGVTSDEILRGEHAPRSEREPGGGSMKVEKQLRHLLERSTVRFQNISHLAAALILVGLICQFAIAYALYRPVIGFAVMLLFAVAGITLELSLMNTLRVYTREHEIIADNEQALEPLRKTAGRYSFTVYMIALAVFILSLPLVLFRDSCFVDSVISMETYLSWLPVLILAILLILAVLLNLLNDKLFLGRRPVRADPIGGMGRMNLAQGAFSLLILALALIDLYYLEAFYHFGPLLFIIFLCSAIATMIVAIAKSKTLAERLLLLAAGLRNLLYLFTLIYFTAGLSHINITGGDSYYYYTFTPGPFLLFLGATAAYVVARRYILLRIRPHQ